jgi:hypothetical protein
MESFQNRALPLCAQEERSNYGTVRTIRARKSCTRINIITWGGVMRTTDDKSYSEQQHRLERSQFRSEHDIEVARREFVRMERALTSLINYRSHHPSLLRLFFRQLFTNKSVLSTSQGLWHDRAQNVLAVLLMCFVNFVKIYEFLMEMTTQDFQHSPLFFPWRCAQKESKTEN